MKQVYPRLKRSRPLPFPLEDCSFPRSGLSDLATLGQTTVRSRKRKVLSRKRKSGLDLFLSGIYLFPALQNIYSFRAVLPSKLCACSIYLHCSFHGVYMLPNMRIFVRFTCYISINDVINVPISENCFSFVTPGYTSFNLKSNL